MEKEIVVYLSLVNQGNCGWQAILTWAEFTPKYVAPRADIHWLFFSTCAWHKKAIPGEPHFLPVIGQMQTKWHVKNDTKEANPSPICTHLCQRLVRNRKYHKRHLTDRYSQSLYFTQNKSVIVTIWPYVTKTKLSCDSQWSLKFPWFCPAPIIFSIGLQESSHKNL